MKRSEQDMNIQFFSIPEMGWKSVCLYPFVLCAFCPMNLRDKAVAHILFLPRDRKARTK